MLNEQELGEHLTKEMVAPTEAQPLSDHTAYLKWNQKYRSPRYSLLKSLQNDLIGQYDELPTCKALWDQLKFSFGGTSTTGLRSLVIKFEEYTKDPKHTMSEHLRVMSNMIGKLRDVENLLTDEQQVRAVIRSLPTSWANMKHILTHSENIKNFSNVSQHVILEAETRDPDKALTYVAQEGSRNANGKRGRQSYVMYGEHPNGGRTEIESRDVDFIESDFPSIGEASKNLDLYELEEVEATLPSTSEGGDLVPHPVVAEDSISDPQPSGSILDSGSTPPGPLGQQDSQLRNGARGRVPRGAISWYSKKNSAIALSTMESEYIACSAAVQEAVWLRSFIQALGVTTHINEAVAVHCENTAALDFVKDPKYHGKAKHIGLRYHFIRTLVAQGEVTMKHIPTGIMVADHLTKPIARDILKFLDG
ncbi:hypothetical protein RJ640_007433 [Escallonia rubra]|uniref:Polyprotein n=1 Tax=Escallonia rubra TaxID=112253 RepID=A0AA88URM4_9ASTE|nr:hypothetical protein RJ640_007433 [Escallonia rubra]